MKLKVLFMRLEKTLSPQTKICKLCFKEISDFSINSLLNHEYSLCFECYKKLCPHFIEFNVDGIKATSLYKYDENLKTLIYQYKGCFDYELKNIFLDRFKSLFFLKYKKFLIVPVPSFVNDDKIRGFNHVEEVFKKLNLPLIKCITKTKKIKQSDQSAKERQNIAKFLKIDDVDFSNRNVLLVDDIYTTGSTIKACINLLKTKNPKKIEVFVLCKTLLDSNIKKTNNNKLY